MKLKPQLSAAEIEQRCLELLKGPIGIKHVRRVKIKPCKGRSCGWDLLEIEPDIGPVAFGEAVGAIRRLRLKVDLAS